VRLALPVEVQAYITALERQIATLQEEIARLQGKVRQDSSNSSRPPSSDSPRHPRRQAKPPTGKKRGAQPGHPGHGRHLRPPEEVDTFIDHRPERCPKCQSELPESLPKAKEPARHQVWELPPVQPVLTEHRVHTLECPSCHEMVRADSAEVPPGSFGPNVAATVALLRGRYRLSERETVALMEDLFGLALSVGSVAELRSEASEALAGFHAEVKQSVAAEAVLNVDETAWKQAGAGRWLWAAVGQDVVLFQVFAARSAQSLRELLGDGFRGVVGSDRFSAYGKALPVERRAVCWAHLKRDFNSFAGWGGAIGEWGNEALAAVKDVFGLWHAFRGGGMMREALRQEMVPIQERLRGLLERGLGLAATGTFCRNLLKLWPALWRFVEMEGVEPTNNAVERVLRPAVLWRKGCFGAGSNWGNRFVERALTVAATCGKQERNLLSVLREAIVAWRAIPQYQPA